MDLLTVWQLQFIPLDNLLIDNGQGILVTMSEEDSLAVRNMIKGSNQGTLDIFNGYNNYFARRKPYRM